MEHYHEQVTGLISPVNAVKMKHYLEQVTGLISSVNAWKIQKHRQHKSMRKQIFKNLVLQLQIPGEHKICVQANNK